MLHCCYYLPLILFSDTAHNIFKDVYSAKTMTDNSNKHSWNLQTIFNALVKGILQIRIVGDC